MKIFKILTVLALILICGISCDEGALELEVTEGGLLNVSNPSLNYVVGNPGPYTSNLTVYQGDVKTTKIEIYKTFYSTRKDTLIKTLVKEDTTVYDTSMLSTTLISNTVLYETINISDEATSYVSFDFTLDDLRKDLVIETEEVPVVTGTDPYEIIKGYTVKDVGDALPTTDGEYSIGDYWEFEYHITTSDNRVLVQSKTTKAAIATRYAGKYRAIRGEYYHPELGNYYRTADWPAETLIESVDATTYRVLEYCGLFDGNEWVFQIVDGVISYPAGQFLNDQPMITCESNPLDMSIACAFPNTNTVVNDDVNGKDQLIMAFGYFTAGSGARQFYQILEKIVE